MNLSVVDALARLALQARREGWDLRIDEPPPELRELLKLCGLTEALGVQPRR